MQHCYNLCRIGWLHINGQTPGRFAQLASFFGPEPAVPHQQLDHHHAAAAAAAPAAEMREELIKCKSASPWTCGGVSVVCSCEGFSWCGPLECQLHCCVANCFNFAARAYTALRRQHSPHALSRWLIADRILILVSAVVVLRDANSRTDVWFVCFT